MTARLLATLCLVAAACGKLEAMPDGPRVTVSSSEVFLAGAVAGPPTSYASFVIANGGTGTLAVPSISIRYTEPAPEWLKVVDMDASLKALQADPGQLTVGTYHATVVVDAPGAVSGPASLSVTFEVRPPALALEASSAELRSHVHLRGDRVETAAVAVREALGGPLPLPRVLSISYLGGSLGLPHGQWLTTTIQGTAAPYQLVLEARTDDLVPGRYDAIVQVASDEARDSPQALLVRLYVSDWQLTTSPGFQLVGHAAVVLQDGKVLVTPVDDSGLDGQLTLLYDPAADSWEQVGSLNIPRTGPSVTLLPDGRVLVAGGFLNYGDYANPGQQTFPDATWELYDPASKTWSATGSLLRGRRGHVAVPLPDGKILIAGGSTWTEATLPGYATDANSEVFDPVAFHSTASAVMAAPHQGGAAVPLADGKVLIAGGDALDAPVTATAELYDPATGLWSATGMMAQPRKGHALVRLMGGKVLAIGGQGESAEQLSSAELYDPATGRWSPTGAMALARTWCRAVLLPSGKVLVAGGGAGQSIVGGLLPTEEAESYDPSTGRWSILPPMHFARLGPTLSVLPSGAVIAIGGSDGSFDPRVQHEQTVEIWTEPHRPGGS